MYCFKVFGFDFESNLHLLNKQYNKYCIYVWTVHKAWYKEVMRKRWNFPCDRLFNYVLIAVSKMYNASKTIETCSIFLTMLLQRSSSSKLSYRENIYTMATYVKDRASPIELANFFSIGIPRWLSLIKVKATWFPSSFKFTYYFPVPRVL